MPENSLVRKALRVDALVVDASLLTSSKSTEAGWCFVACKVGQSLKKWNSFKRRARQGGSCWTWAIPPSIMRVCTGLEGLWQGRSASSLIYDTKHSFRKAFKEGMFGATYCCQPESIHRQVFFTSKVFSWGCATTYLPKTRINARADDKVIQTWVQGIPQGLWASCLFFSQTWCQCCSSHQSLGTWIEIEHTVWWLQSASSTSESWTCSIANCREWWLKGWLPSTVLDCSPFCWDARLARSCIINLTVHWTFPTLRSTSSKLGLWALKQLLHYAGHPDWASHSWKFILQQKDTFHPSARLWACKKR